MASQAHQSHPWGKGTLPVRGEAPRAVVAAAHAAALRGVASAGKKSGRHLPRGKAELRAARIASKRAARATSGTESFDPSRLMEALAAAALAQGVVRSEGGGGGGGGGAEATSSSESSAPAPAAAGEAAALAEVAEAAAEEAEDEDEDEEEGEEEEEEDNEEGSGSQAGERGAGSGEEGEGATVGLEGGSVVVQTERLSVVARGLALRLGSALGWRGAERGAGGGRRAKRRLAFTLENAALGASVDALRAAHALCEGFAAARSGSTLADTVARLKALRKARHAKRAQAQTRQGKVRFVAREGSDGEGEPEGEGGAAAPPPPPPPPRSSSAAVSPPIAFVREGGGSSGGEGEDGSSAPASAAAAAAAAAAVTAAAVSAAAAAEGGGGPAPTGAAALEGLGEWEAHTRGFAARMLLKMGFAGGSLGRHGGGAAVVAYEGLRANRGKAGLGASAPQ